MRAKGKSSFLKADEILFQRSTSLVRLMTRISGSSSTSASWLWFYILCRTISVADAHILVLQTTYRKNYLQVFVVFNHSMSKSEYCFLESAQKCTFPS